MTTDPIRPNTVILTLGAVFFLAACGSDGDPGTGPGDTLGSVRVGASTSGDDLDADGYTVALDGSGSRPLGMNGTTTFSDVAPGNREVELDGVAGNCAVEGANPRTVEVTAGAEATTTFQVACEVQAAALAFTSQPQEVELHQAIPAVEVALLDAAGSPIPATHDVAIRLGANPMNAALSGTTTVGAANGVARFDDLAIDRRGTGYTLVATVLGLPESESAPFDVTFAFETISPGSGHTCGLTTGGVAYCWGGNSRGQLGDGNGGTDSDVPVAVATELRFVRLSAGSGHTCALTANDEAYCWGSDHRGALGDGGLEADSDTPVPVEGGLALKSVSAGGAAGGSHTCALTGPPARAVCWGRDTHGQLGNGDPEADSDVPVPVSGDLAFTAVAAGGVVTCALLGLDAYCWGRGEAGELGDGLATDSTTPVLVSGNHDIVEVAVGAGHACALRIDNKAICWGRDEAGQLGDANEASSSPLPVEVASDLAFRVPSLTAGGGHSCAMRVEGASSRVYCWGSNTDGELGNGILGINADIPVPVEGGDAFSDVVAGSRHTCALTPDGAAFCWGFNFSGQLGAGSNAGTRSSTPVPVVDPPN